MARPGGVDKGLFQRPADSGIWWIRWRGGDGLYNRKKVGSKARAIAEYTLQCGRVAHEKDRPDLVADQPVAMTVGDLVDRYAEESKMLANWKHFERYGKYWKKALGSVPIKDLRAYDVEAYKGRRLASVSPSTVNKEVSRLKRLFSLAVRDELIPANPLARVRKLPEAHHRVRWMNADEEALLRAVYPPHWWYLVEFAYRTGMRSAEQFHLPRTAVDFRANRIVLAKTKDRKGRILPMSKKVRALIEAHLAASPHSPWVFPSSRNPESHLSARNAYRVFEAAVLQAGIDHLTWHDLRHTYASRIVMKGGDLSALQELLGHASITTTMRYAHLAPGRLLTTTCLLDDE